MSKIYTWTEIYQELADKVLAYKDNRGELVKLLEEAYKDANQEYKFIWKEHYFTQIDPFTLFGSFNKGISDKNRIELLRQYKNKFGLKSELPSEFTGIPVFNNMQAWLMDDTPGEKMETYWDIFETAIRYADGDGRLEDRLIGLFDKAVSFKGTKWNLTMGLYWIRPFTFINLDTNNRDNLKSSGYYGGVFPSGKEYLDLCKGLAAKMDSDEFPYSSFPEFSAQSKVKNQPEKLSKVEFIKWFSPLLQALKDLGGRATPAEAINHIIDNESISESEINKILEKSGQNKLDNQIRWARQYLVWAGYIDGSEHGIWKLTDEGEEVEMTDELASSILRKASASNKKKNENIGSALADDDVDKTRYWMYAPGENADKWNELYEKNIMAIGGGIIGDLAQYDSKDDMKQAMKEKIDPERSFKNDSLATWQFANEMQPGDIVFVKKGMSKIIGRGIVKSEYIFDPTDGDYSHTRKVEWTDKGEWEHPGQAVMKALTDVTRYTDYVQKLEELFGRELEDSKDIEKEYPLYDATQFLDEVFMNDDSYYTLVELVRDKKNVILQGAPGVGKTFAAKRLAYSMIGSKNQDRVMMVQFHQSYSYEDFIEGLRPSKTGMNFDIKRGAFLGFCDNAREDLDNEYFFIIDEINRGNLSKIFGELFMLIENDKRGNELQLLYSGDKFSVPKNIYIIGMMNTADRSLALLDYALRRRFAFYEMKPGFNTDGFKAYRDALNNAKFNKLLQCVERLNERIKDDDSLGEGFCIGHSYFCDKKNITDKTLSNIVEFELIPLLKEYWFDDTSTVIEWTDALRSSIK